MGPRPCEVGVEVPCALVSAGSEEDMVVALAPGDEELEKVLRMAESSQGGFRVSVTRVLVDEFRELLLV